METTDPALTAILTELAAHEQEMLDQIVYMGHTKRALNEAFKRVEPVENWKMPIDKTLPADTSIHDLSLICHAVAFFCGSPSKVTQTPDGWRIEADGYYRCVGA